MSAAPDPASARVVALLQARMTSTRLPGKVLEPLADASVLEIMIRRLLRAQTLHTVCVATTTNATDDPIADLAASLGLPCHRGSEDDVLARMLGAAREADADVVVRVTGDCPLIEPVIIDACVLGFFAGGVDYCSNTIERTFPRGLDNEVTTVAVLEDVAARSTAPEDREHVTLHIYDHPERYRLRTITAVGDLRRPTYRWTVDTPEDLAFVRAVVEELGPDCRAVDAARLCDRRPDLVAINAHTEQKPVR